MLHRITCIVFVLFTLALSTNLKASETIATANFGPGPTVNYVETVGPATTNSLGFPNPPLITGSSSPCTTLAGGCQMGSFSTAFPTITVPTGDYIKSASLIIYYAFTVTGTPLTLASVTPIDPLLPYTAGTPGNNADLLFFTITSAAGNFNNSYGASNGVPDVLSNSQAQIVDYTAAVMSADSNGIISLAPISVSNDFEYDFKTAQSAFGGVNSNTIFTRSFDLSGATLVADLTIVFAPEPSAGRMLSVGLVLLLFGVLPPRRRRVSS